MILIALLIVFMGVGVFAMENRGTQDFAFLGSMWHEPLWLPVAIGVGLVSALLLLHMSSTLGYRFTLWGHRRQLEGHRGQIEDLRDENTRLREELAAARGRTSAATSANRASWMDGVRSLPNRLAGR
jgi:uncharacterized integral membrane protein